MYDDEERIELEVKYSKEKEMSDPVNVFTTNPAPVMGCGGYGGFGGGGFGGFGGDGMGALLAVALLGGGNGFGFGNRGGNDCNRGCDGGRDSACLNGTDGMALMNAIGNVKDTVAGSTAALTGAIMDGFAMQSTNTLQQTIMLTGQANANQIMTVQGLNLVNQNVSDQGCKTRETICMDGNATRALITQLNTDNLNRLLTVADLDRRDECNRARQREVEVTVTQTVNQNQLQLQAQQQQQRFDSKLDFLCSQLAAVHQEARATNQNIIAGNTGAVTTAAQTATASPTNVST